jgi:spoIIIJ-associated protein
MSSQQASLEIVAPTVEEAVAQGLQELGISEDAVEVEVLDAGSRGLFGLGARQARVRLMIKGARPAGPEFQPEPPAAVVQPAPSDVAPVVEEQPAERELPRKRERPQPAAPPQRPAKPVPSTPAQPAEEVFPPAGTLSDEDDEALRVASATVRELLGHMRVRAEVNARYSEPDEPNSKPAILVDVLGKDLSILIGPRAETLNALQYIAGLIVSKELGRSAPLIVDVEHFRQRREQQLRQLARRMADQAVKTGRRQVLEPMPANERRLVHIELRSNPDVTTQSIGEEPRRKVTIIPEK